ncbi:210_t:CDS:1, partial [Entrophospora sp. SA101]
TSSSPSPLLPSSQIPRSLSSSPPLSVDHNFYDEEELPGKRNCLRCPIHCHIGGFDPFQ